METWDAYDRQGNKINITPLIRGNDIPQGVFHLVCDVLVIHTDGTYLLTQRDFRKNFGGMWEATAGGSALQGEGALACAKRELYEETGIIPDSIKQAGTVIHELYHSIYCEFIGITKMNKNNVILQNGETVNYRWVKKEELFSMSVNELASTRILTYII